MVDENMLSVVITTYNRSEALLPVIRALGQQLDKQFEVVIADDGSNSLHTDAIERMAESSGLRVAHVWHPDVGFTASIARNLGVRHSKGGYIVLMDGDCIPDVDFISQHRSLRDRDCFVNGSRVLLSSGFSSKVIAGVNSITGRGLFYWTLRRLCGDANKLSGSLRMSLAGIRRQPGFKWKGIRSCNMGVWRHHFEAVNGFDASFSGWGHEDADFVLRLHNAGVIRKNGFFATEVYHLWHREASRDRESVNAKTVLARMVSGQVMADIGYLQCDSVTEVKVRRWG